jgi:hypothetical protein
MILNYLSTKVLSMFYSLDEINFVSPWTCIFSKCLVYNKFIKLFRNYLFYKYSHGINEKNYIKFFLCWLKKHQIQIWIDFKMILWLIDWLIDWLVKNVVYEIYIYKYRENCNRTNNCPLANTLIYFKYGISAKHWIKKEKPISYIWHKLTSSVSWLVPSIRLRRCMLVNDFCLCLLRSCLFLLVSILFIFSSLCFS